MDSPTVLPWPKEISAQGGETVSGPFAITAPDGVAPLIDRFVSRAGIARSDTGTPFTIACGTPHMGLPTLDDPEDYRLSISADGITLEAPHWRGLAHGLSTLEQLATKEGFSPVEIEDSPRFAWRGVKLDCVRHFLCFKTVLRILDAMALAKFNVLHWGVTNYQGFRLESHRFPRLHREASNGQFYTQEEVRAIIGYAAERGIRVVPEFNMPGHSTAFLVAHPELAAGDAPNGLAPGFGILNDVMHPASDAVFTFIEEFVEEFATLFPDSHWHMGGDEVMGANWDADPTVQAFKTSEGLADNRAIQARFTERCAAIVRAAGKVPMGWEEVGYGGPDPDAILLESWIDWAGSDHCKPYSCVSATGYYLDHFLTAVDHYRIDPEAHGGTVLGGEAAVWTEAMMDETVEGYIWPRAGAIAERLWSPATQTDKADLYRRLSSFDALLEQRGARHHHARALVLDRAAGGVADHQWHVLASALRPTAYYFLRWEGYDCATPANRLVQALDSDPPMARRFNEGVTHYLKTGEGRASLEATLNTWGNTARRIRVGEDDKPAARAVAELCELGLALLRGDQVDGTELLKRTTPAFPKSAIVPDLLEAIFTVFGDEARPLALKHMNVAFWPGVKALAEAAQND